MIRVFRQSDLPGLVEDPVLIENWPRHCCVWVDFVVDPGDDLWFGYDMETLHLQGELIHILQKRMSPPKLLIFKPQTLHHLKNMMNNPFSVEVVARYHYKQDSRNHCFDWWDISPPILIPLPAQIRIMNKIHIKEIM